MPANQEDLDAVFAIVEDATQLLDWCAGSDAFFVDDSETRREVLPTDLVDAYRAAVDQAQTEAFELALRTLRGGNTEFPITTVLRLLELAGWTAALRDFKLQALTHSGREEVMTVARGGRTAGGPIRRTIFRRFKAALNAALDSLAGIPGVAAIKELKDFLGGAQED